MKTEVILPVYAGDQAEVLAAALDSIFVQKRSADIVTIYVDGPVCENIEFLIKLTDETHSNVQVKRNKRQLGLAKSLNRAIFGSEADIIIRADADDINLPNRFELILKAMAQYEAALVGTAIYEVDPKNRNINSLKNSVPTGSIVKKAVWRNPFNHMTTAFRRSSFVEVGGYPENMPYREDYGLWIRFMTERYIMVNLPDPLVKASCGDGRITRRRGLAKNFHAEFRLACQKLESGLWPSHFVVLSFIIRVMTLSSPTAGLRFFYQFTRKKINEN